MTVESEYEMIPLSPVTYNAIPEAMKEFIVQCGMMEALPRDYVVKNAESDSVEVLNVDSLRNNYNYDDGEDYEDDIDKYVEELINIDKEVNKDRVYKNRGSEDERVENIITNLEKENKGIFKFLEVNGISYDRSKKFIKRVVRLAIKSDV
ncbi:MAG: hypothetical protein E6929_01985 [Clostridium sp.]|nr:hypothetical protein [Clostridium sp.]